MSHHPLLVYDVRHPTGEESQGVGYPVERPDLTPLVAEQDEGQAVLLSESLMRPYRVAAYPYHLGFQFVELLMIVSEGTSFLGARWGVVFGVEEEDDGPLFAQEVPEADPFPDWEGSVKSGANTP